MQKTKTPVSVNAKTESRDIRCIYETWRQLVCKEVLERNLFSYGRMKAGRM